MKWICLLSEPLWSRPTKDGPIWFYSKQTATSVDSIGVSRGYETPQAFHLKGRARMP